MSPIAKLFTALNVILAGLFVGWAASTLSTQADFKRDLESERTSHSATKEALGSDKSKLLAEKAELEKTRATITSERDDARAEVDRYKAQVADEERKNNDLRGDVQKIANSIDNLTAQNKQLAEARDRAMTAQRDAEKAKNDAVAAQTDAEKKAGELEGQLHTAQNSIADLEKTRTTLGHEKEAAETQLSSLAAATNAKLSDFSPMPLIEGAVLAVNYDVAPGLVSINKGSADKVKRGYTFEIYDGKTYKGQAKVEYVHDNMCSALMVRAVPGQKVRQGDSAATRLN